jgi:catechol 2,3-dioxygenase-like lactoylglutathione lyase family enzyme
MTRRLDHVGLMVDDMDAAVAWYCDVLGCSVKDAWANDETGMRWAHIAYGDVPIELVFRPGLEPKSPSAAGHHHIAVEVDDCAATVAELETRGVTVVFPPSYFERHDMDWAFIADPFGNVLEILSYRAVDR